jgi:dephospho-CoA kinase
MIQLAVTGGIACGKSMVASLMEANGVCMLEADRVAHSLLEPEHPLARRVTQEFGPEIVGPDGRIDRKILGRMVFSNESCRNRLNALMHPEVKRVCRAWLDERQGAEIAGVVVPLLYESGMADGWDAVLCVWAPRKLQMDRLKGRGFSEEEAGQRIAAQLPIAEKIAGSNHVFVNYGTPEFLEDQVVRVLDSIREKSNAR